MICITSESPKKSVSPDDTAITSLSTDEASVIKCLKQFRNINRPSGLLVFMGKRPSQEMCFETFIHYLHAVITSMLYCGALVARVLDLQSVISNIKPIIHILHFM